MCLELGGLRQWCGPSRNMAHTAGGTLLTWGLREWRLGRMHGEVAVPEPALPELKVRAGAAAGKCCQTQAWRSEVCWHAVHPRAHLPHAHACAQVVSVAGSRHSAIATAEGHVWTMGHNDSRGGGGHGSAPMLQSGQLGRQDSSVPGRVMGELEVGGAWWALRGWARGRAPVLAGGHMVRVPACLRVRGLQDPAHTCSCCSRCHRMLLRCHCAAGQFCGAGGHREVPHGGCDGHG